MGGLDDACGAGGGHRARRARPARRLRLVPPARAHREDGGDDPGGERRPVRPRPRCRLERDRVPRLRPAVRPSRLALRGVVRDRPAHARRRAGDARGPVLAGGRSRRPAAAGAAGPADDRLERPAHARGHAPVRRPLEHLVRPLRQHGRGLCRAERVRDGAVRAGRAGPGRRSTARLRCWSSSTPTPPSGRTPTSASRATRSRRTRCARTSTPSRRPARTRRS